MALAKVKLGSSGGKGKERWMTRAECKEGSSKRRRRVDRELADQEISDRYTQPFCACGRIVGECDGSRRGCGKNNRPAKIDGLP